MNTYAINYTYSDQTAASRDEVRPVHVEFLKARFEAGDLRISGPVGSGTGALLVVQADNEEAALEMMNQDPFAQAGLITKREIRRWDVFFGKDKL